MDEELIITAGSPIDEIKEAHLSDMYETDSDVSVLVTAQPSLLRSIMLPENRTLVVHTITDVIFFYMFFNYMRNQFHITQQLINNTKERLVEIKTQYGFDV